MVEVVGVSDCLVVSGTKTGRAIGYVDHLLEHFLEPCDSRASGS
ncbi:MAG: hypothetical protein ACYC0C_01290 [Devosia sp.]